jgi:hypothetical protein
MITFLVSALVLLAFLGYACFWVRVLVGITTALIWGTSAAPVGRPAPPSAFPPYAR